MFWQCCRILWDFRFDENYVKGGVHKLMIIKNLPQGKAVCWSGLASGYPILLSQHGSDSRYGKFSNANLNQGSNHTSTHFIEEAVPFYYKCQQWTRLADRASEDSPNGIFNWVCM